MKNLTDYKSSRGGLPEVVLAVVVKNNNILLIKRDIPGVDTTWMLPGGKLEDYETPLEAAQREVMEETGIRCEPIDTIDYRIHPISNKIMSYVLCKYLADDEDVIKEYDIEWMDAKRIPDILGRTVSLTIKNATELIGQSGLATFQKMRSALL